MRAVDIEQLKNRLSEYIRLVAAGETILVTDRDRVVAELSPPREGRSFPLAGSWHAEAVRQGWLTPATHPRGPMPPRRPVARLEDLLRDLDEDRADR